MGQLALACAEGAVEWLYPAGALRLTLGGPDPRARPGIACLRPVRPFAGAQVFAERAGGALELLLAEGPGPAGGRCVRWGPRERRALFLQATPHRDISRRVAAFRFELREDGRPELPPQAHGLGVDGEWRSGWDRVGVPKSYPAWAWRECALSAPLQREKVSYKGWMGLSGHTAWDCWGGMASPPSLPDSSLERAGRGRVEGRGGRAEQSWASGP